MKTVQAKLLSFMIVLIAALGCAGKKTQDVQINAQPDEQLVENSESSVEETLVKQPEASSGGIDERDLPKDLSRSIQHQRPRQETKRPALKTGEYLVIKFHQNDTDVEMVVDPHSTNLNLELVRGPDGYLEIMNGDSTLYKKDAASSKKEPAALLTGARGNSLESEHLTDEIIRDINLAQKMFYERKYSEALQVLQESIKKKQTATAYALGGSIYYVNGEIDAAVNAWENALKINPNLTEVRELILRHKQ